MKIRKIIICLVVLAMCSAASTWADEQNKEWIKVGEAVHVFGNSGSYYLTVEEKEEYCICAYNANDCDTFLKLYREGVLFETADDGDGRYGKYGNFILEVVLEPGVQYEIVVNDDNESYTGFVFSVVKKGESLPEYDGKTVESKDDLERQTLGEIEVTTQAVSNTVQSEVVSVKGDNKAKDIKKPKKTKIISYKIKNNKVVIKYKKIKKASGYEIESYKTKSFKKTRKAVNSNNQYSISTKSKRNYIRVRAFVLTGDKVKFSKWSNVVKTLH